MFEARQKGSELMVAWLKVDPGGQKGHVGRPEVPQRCIKSKKFSFPGDKVSISKPAPVKAHYRPMGDVSDLIDKQGWDFIYLSEIIKEGKEEDIEDDDPLVEGGAPEERGVKL